MSYLVPLPPAGAAITVSISGQPVGISGQTVVGNFSASVSGQTVYVVSGKSYLQIFDPSGNQWLDLWSNASGSHNLAVTANVVTNISGQHVVVSGLVGAQAFDLSGNTWRPFILDRSGGRNVRMVIGDPNDETMAQLNTGNTDTKNPTNNGIIAIAYAHAYDPITDQWKRPRVTASGQGMSGIVHRLAVAFSGDPVSISGQAVSISGQTVVTSVTTNVSGQAVYIAGSGHNSVVTFSRDDDAGGVNDETLIVSASLQGYDQSLNRWTRARITSSGKGISGIPHKLVVTFSGDSIIGSVSGNAVAVSGQAVLISGQTVVANVVTNISGQTVYLASGQNNVQMSGETVRLVSGDTTQVIIRSTVGNAADVEASIASDSKSTGISALDTQAYMMGFNQQSGNWARLRVTSSGQGISGIPIKLVVTFSGDSIVGSVSGNMVSVSGQPVLVSGQLVAVSGLIATSVSGNMVSVSGQAVTVSGNVVNTSGNVNYDFGTVIRTTSGTIVTSLSGGTELGSGVVINATVRNLSGNAPIYVGGTGTEAPFSGKGMILFSNETQTYDIDNFNKIRVFANTSGQRVRVIGVAAN